MVKIGTVELRMDAMPEEMWVSAQEISVNGNAILKNPMKA